MSTGYVDQWDIALGLGCALRTALEWQLISVGRFLIFWFQSNVYFQRQSTKQPFNFTFSFTLKRNNALFSVFRSSSSIYQCLERVYSLILLVLGFQVHNEPTDFETPVKSHFFLLNHIKCKQKGRIGSYLSLKIKLTNVALLFCRSQHFFEWQFWDDFFQNRSK